MSQDKPKPPPESKGDAPFYRKAEHQRPRSAFQQARRAIGQGASAVGGFVENTFDDAFDILKGLYQLIPTIGRSSYQIWKDRQWLGRSFSEGDVTKSISQLPGQIKDAIIAPYKEHGVGVLYKKPVTVLLDLLTLVDGGAHSVLKLAPKGSRLAKAAEAVRAAPGRLLTKGIDEAVMKTTGWDRAKARKVAQYQRNTYGMLPEQVAKDRALASTFAKLTDEEAALLEDVTARGMTAEEAAAHPNVKQALNEWRQLQQQSHQPYLVKEGLLNDARIRATVERKFVAHMKEKGIQGWESISKENLRKARQIIEALPEDQRPVYRPAFFEQEGATIEKLLSQPNFIKSVRTAMLETYTGKAGAIKDPRVYMPKAIENFRKTQANLEFYKQILHDPELSKAVKGGQGLGDLMPFQGVQKHYFEDAARAQGVKVGELRRTHGDAFDDLIKTNPSIQKEIAEATQVIVDPTVRKLIQLRESRVGGGLAATVHLYDKIINAFKLTATKFNPRWYTGQAIGDALLGQLAGADWAKAIEYLKKKGKLPPEVLGAGGMHGSASGGWLSDLAQAPDILARTGIIAKESIARMVKAGYTLEQAELMLPAVLESTRDFYKVHSELVVLREQIARGSGAIRDMDRTLERLIAKERKLAERVNHLTNPPSLIKAEHKAITPELRRGVARKTKGFGKKLTAAEAELETLRQEIVNLGTKREMTLSDLTNDLLNEKGLSGRMPELQRMMDFVNPAIEKANAFIGDYLGLNGFEQGVMKRLVPFYSWTKAMTQLAFRLPFIAPAKTFLWHRYAMAMATLIGDDNLPEWVRGYVPVFARENGDLVWVRMSSFSPFSGVKTSKFGGVPIPNVLAVHEQNPLISLSYQLAGGKTIFQRSTIPYGEQMVNIANGDVYQFQENGMLKKVIPQTPIVSGIAHMFPITQWLESVLTPYVVSKYDWMGFPEPMLKPNGDVKYPRELYQNILSAFGFSTMQRSVPNLIKGERAKVRQVIRQFRKAYRRASPDEKEYIRKALQDYQRGQYRMIEGD